MYGMEGCHNILVQAFVTERKKEKKQKTLENFKYILKKKNSFTKPLLV